MAEAEVLSLRRQGGDRGYWHLVLLADEVASAARPGCFVAVRVGGSASALVRRRAFWVHRARPKGAYGGTIEVVFAECGPGTRWLAGLAPHDRLDVLGPLGRPFSLPREPVGCVLVGHGLGAAALFLLAEGLRERGCGVHLVVGADSEHGLVAALESRRVASSVTVTTVDGSVGLRGTPTDVLPDVLRRTAADVVYASGPVHLLQRTTEVAQAAGAWAQVAVEPEMPCGTGLCGGCGVLVRGGDGNPRRVLACVDGPVLAAERVAWGTA